MLSALGGDMRNRLSLALLVFLLSVSWSSALAQAQTPTPTPFVIPPTVTPVPIGGGFGQNGSFWICTLFQDAAAWYCKPTNNGNFSVSTSVQVIGSGDSKLKNEYHKLVVPTNVTAVTLFCAYGYTGGEAHTNAIFGGHTQTVGGSASALTRFGTWSQTQSIGSTIYGGSRGTGGSAVNHWTTHVQTFPAGIGVLETQQSGIGFFTSANATGFTGIGGVQYAAFAEAVIQCQVQSYSTDNGFPQNWVDERTPTPVPTLTPVPTATPFGWGGTAQPWDAPPVWPTPVAVAVTTGLTPGSRACNTIVPAFTFGPYTVFGYELGASWSAIQVCNTETTFAWNVLGFNFGAYIALIVAIGAIGLLYSRMR